MSESMQFPGDVLKQERMRQDLTEREVADKLHLSLSYLQAIEADDYDHLPERTFIKGYIRNYARLLGLAGEELAATFDRINRPLEDEKQSVTSLPDDEDSHKRHRLIAIIMVTVLVVLAALWQWVGPGFGYSPAQSDTVTSVETPVENSLTDVKTTVDDSAVSVNLPKKSSQTAESAAADEGNVTTQSVTTIEDKAATGVATLHIAFSASCWTEVTSADGESLFQGTKQAGEIIELTGKAPFQVMFGNAGGVASISVNDQPVDLADYQAGQVETIQVP